MNAPLHPLKPDAHRRLMVGDMARAIVEAGCDLGDERHVIACLLKSHRRDDVAALLDPAIEAARSLATAFAVPN